MVADRILRLSVTCLGLLLVGAVARPASAQSLDSLRKQYLIPVVPGVEITTVTSRSVPGNSLSTPSAFGASLGDGFVGAAYQNSVRGSNTNDGAVVAGFGLGNPRDYVGLEVAVTSFSTVREGFGQRGGLSFKLHRLLPWNSSVAVGWEDAANWGGTDGGSSVFAVGSKVFRLRQSIDDPFGALTLSLGGGNGRFRTLSDVLVHGNSDNSQVNVFGSAGLRVHQAVSLIADWGGQDLTLAASVVPFRSIPLVITPGFTDVTRRANATPRFIIGAGLGFKFGRIRSIFLPPR